MASRWILPKINWSGISVFALLLAAWEVSVRSGAISFEFFPAPSAIFAGAVELARDGILLQDLLHTVLSIAIGWTIAMIVGVSLGLLLGFSPLARRYGLASIEVLRPMPGIAFAPLGLLLFGFSMQTELVVMVLPTVWPVIINSIGGIANVQPRLTDVGRASVGMDHGTCCCRRRCPRYRGPGSALATLVRPSWRDRRQSQGLGYGIVRDSSAASGGDVCLPAVVGLLGSSSAGVWG
jgi:ABC-type proline/glycine betaine transport system permease subunit